ncbi:putative Oxidoreductase-like domain-containing protein [Seiridium unicorne]|uniref:Oxidoreductase-like domain-containing protein n=1 Tax=Seiridium unicorne TaxID=138068 RepID=A0ABR2UR61_9PEZI
MSALGSRSLFRGAAKLSSTFPRRSISSFDKTPPAPNKGHNSGSEQAHPIGPYYEAIIVTPQPIPETKPEDPPTSSPKSPRSTVRKNAAAQDEQQQPVDTTAAPAPSPSANPATAQDKARIIFGSQLAGPFERAERLRALKDKSTMIAGIMVPPKPDEPDNCCMSGCVNCVWDRYRDEMEEWVTLSKQAERKLQAQRAQGPVDVLSSVSAVKGMEGLKGPAATKSKTAGVGAGDAVSMDDDGGGSETNWSVDQPKIAKDLWEEDIFKGVPVGIREFMKTEKKLKAKHEQEGSIGG